MLPSSGDDSNLYIANNSTVRSGTPTSPFFDDKYSSSFYSTSKFSGTLFDDSFDDLFSNSYTNGDVFTPLSTPGVSRGTRGDVPADTPLEYPARGFTAASSAGISPNGIEHHKPLFGVHPQVIPFTDPLPYSQTSFQSIQHTPSGSFASATPTPFQTRTSGLNASSSSTLVPSIPTQVAGLSRDLAIDPDKLNWITVDGFTEVQCLRCSKFIKTGSTTQSMVQFYSHRAGKRCQRHGSAGTLQQAERSAAINARKALFSVSLPEKENSSVKVKPGRPTKSSVTRLQVETPGPGPHLDQSDFAISDSESALDYRMLDGSSTETITPSSSLSLTMHRSRASVECPGLPLDWPLDYFYESYPFSRHDATGQLLGFRLSFINPYSQKFRIRSEICLREHLEALNNNACRDCQKLTKAVEHLALKAEHAEPCTNFKYLSSRQMTAVTREKDKTIQGLRLMILALTRKYATLVAHHDDAKRFIMAVATNDIPRLHQLVKQCLKNNASIKQIIAKLEGSVAKVYSARGYEQIDLDIALLCYRLGGRSLLYAMNQQSSIPSLRTLRRSQAFTRLMPSHGCPTVHEITYNLKQVLDPHDSSLDPIRPFCSGMSIFWDEINQEDAACYFPHSDSVGGLCREHNAAIDMRLRTFESAVSIAKALADGTVHYGKEVSVIAVGSFGTVLQGALPIVLSPTCKKETPMESAIIAKRVIATYKQYAAERYGPLWCVSSDGDAGRRFMAHVLFMVRTVDTGHVLYKYVGRLTGLNLQVGEDDITADIDWKHLMKRIARLLRSTEGTIVGDTVVNREVLIRHLNRIPGLTAHRIQLLMDPADAQDVPRAMELIATIGQIATMPAEECSPSEQQEAQMISIIGEMFEAFQNAFTNVEWNLTEQLISLSKYAHMACILFRRHCANFMPNQLYIDSQTCIKNAIFCVAKQQDLDCTQDFHLFLTGDDRLENLFGRIRMQGGHNPNCTFKQMVDRAGAAVDLNNVFTRNPSLDPGHRRLKVNRTEHFDHLNKKSWRGCQSVQYVVLEHVWSTGRAAADLILKKMNCNEDMEKVFHASTTIDLMRPFGDGHYPGVSDLSESDRSSLLTNSNLENAQTEQPIAAPLTLDEILNNSNHDDVLQDVGTESDETEEDNHMYNAFAFDSEDMQYLEATQQEPPDVSDCAGVVENELGLEDVIDEPPELQLPSSVDQAEGEISPWIQQPAPGKPIHKATICRVIINPNWTRKSHERILRVRGYTSERKFQDLNSDNLIDNEAFIVGDLFASLIRCGGIVSLAIVKCIAIEEKGVRVDRVDRRSLVFVVSKIHLCRQILEMQAIPQVCDLEENPATDNTPEDDVTWIWTGLFTKLNTGSLTQSMALKGKAARKTLIVKIPSQLCQTVSPQVTHIDSVLPAESQEHLSLGDSKITWAFNEASLQILIEKLWQAAKADNSLNLLPKFSSGSAFPYKNLKGNAALATHEGTAAFVAVSTTQTEKYRCYQCLQHVEPAQARDHAGRHVLRSMRNVAESLSGEPINGDFPCGFCGRSGVASCAQIFLSKGKKPQAKSGCQHFVKFKYQSALVSTTSTPCTNVPILCTIPNCTKTTNEGLSAIWKYNMAAHIRTEHPGLSFDTQHGTTLPNDLVDSIYITDEEEKHIKIPADKIPYKISPANTTQGSKRSNADEHTSVSKRRR